MTIFFSGLRLAARSFTRVIQARVSSYDLNYALFIVIIKFRTSTGIQYFKVLFCMDTLYYCADTFPLIFQSGKTIICDEQEAKTEPLLPLHARHAPESSRMG